MLQEAKARWGNLTPEARRRLLSLLAGLPSLLPLGRLGRVGLLLDKALGSGGQVAFSLLLPLLRREDFTVSLTFLRGVLRLLESPKAVY
ncbi:hypothetical protein, partial [Thermus scotoductus]|uniref:hypothetical protein n=1 Tax=Thermus scotoductus TaxID=37636 RepID=UPI001C12C860